MEVFRNALAQRKFYLIDRYNTHKAVIEPQVLPAFAITCVIIVILDLTHTCKGEKKVIDP